MELLKNLINVHAPSGEEFRMKEFLLDYISAQKYYWKVMPEVVYGPEFQDVVILIFGKPRTAILAHVDTIGFTTRYANQLVPIGGPEAERGFELTGEDSKGPINCKLIPQEGRLFHDFPREIDRGTSLVFKSNFRQTEECVQSPYLDNRLGVYNALKVAEKLEDGIIIFTTYEEHGGGSIPFVLSYLEGRFQIRSALVSDITWVSEGVQPGKGVTISLRDRNIPRKVFLDKILQLALKSGIPYQLEVEGDGSSDGREIQISPFPLDWCFIGAPEDLVHSPDERVYLKDIDAMIEMYNYLMKNL